MATIYRIIVEQQTRGGSTGRKSSEDSGISPKSAAKKGRYVAVFGGRKGGVEHNRKMRAINPVLNKATGGYWEKGMRLGRAGLGLVRRNTETGEIKLGGPAIAIIIAFILQSLIKLQNKERIKAQELNAQNYKSLENGVGAIHSAYTVSVNGLTGRQTYNQNK